MKLSTQLFITTLSKTTESIGIFVLSIILARYFTKVEYGTYLHVQLIVNIAVWSFLLGIPHGVYYFLPKVMHQKKYLINTLLLTSAIGVIVSFLVYVLTPQISLILINEELVTFGLVIALLVLFQIPITIFEPVMVSVGRVKEFSIIKALFSVIFFLSILIPVLNDASLMLILQSLAFSFLVQVSIVLYYSVLVAMQMKGVNTAGDECTLSEYANYCLPIGLSTGIGEMSSYADKLIVSNQSSPEEYAVYARGAMDLPIISIIANTLDNLLMPRFVRAFNNNNLKEVMESWHTTIRLMASFIYPCCLFLVVVAPILIPALFSNKYAESVIIFQVYTLGLLTRISTFSIIVRAIGKTKVILWVTLVTVIGNIILTLIMMSWWGLIGAPIATVIVMTISRLIYVYSITQYLNIKINNVFPWLSLAHSLVASIVSVIPIIGLMNLGKNLNEWVLMGLAGILFTICYVGITKVSSSLTLTDKSLVRSILPDRFKWVI